MQANPKGALRLLRETLGRRRSFKGVGLSYARAEMSRCNIRGMLMLADIFRNMMMINLVAINAQ
jgi:hypothetical protein